MKQFIFIFLFCINLNAQQVDKLEVNNIGVVGYLVKEYPNKTESEIFNAIKEWVSYNLTNSQFATKSIIQDKYLVFNLRRAGFIYNNNRRLYELDLMVEARIKKGKLRIDLAIIDMPHTRMNNLRLYLQKPGSLQTLYNLKGKPRKSFNKIRQSLNDELNRIGQELLNCLNKKDYKKDDW